MMDHKTIANRDAKAEVQLMIAGITEDRKKELIEQYHNPAHCLHSTNSQKMLIGNWLNNATKMLLKGATEEEMNRVVEHIVVLLHAVKCELDIQRSYKDRDLHGLSMKYFRYFRKVETADGPIFIDQDGIKHDPPEVRRQWKEAKEKTRKELKEKAQNMKDSGLTNEQIANELVVPESTIRNLIKE